MMGAAVLLAVPLSAVGQAQPLAGTPLEERIVRLERLLSSSALLQLMENIEALRKDVRELRGEIELQSHGVTQVKQRQRELYLDVDRRLQRMETLSRPIATAAPTPTPGTQPATGRTTGATTVQPAPATPTTAAAASGTGASTPAATASPPTTPTTGAATPTVTATPTPTVTATQAPPVDPVKEQQTYKYAFNFLKTGRYDRATEAFRQFLIDYPTGQFSDNAQYWLSETYYVTRQFELAMGEFQRLLASFPDSQKQTHAMLKIGYIHQELGQLEEAKQTLEDLANRFPQSTAAGLARRRLQRLRGE